MNRNDIHSVQVGDRVRINETDNPWDRHFNGEEGIVSSRRGNHQVTVHLNGGWAVPATNVTKLCAEPVEELADWEKELLDGTRHLDGRRVQAVRAAHEILKEVVPDLDDVLKLADYLQAGEPVRRPDPVEPSDETLHVTDEDGDRLDVASLLGGRHVAAIVTEAREGCDRSAVYLTEADVDAVISRLQQFKAHARAAAETPF